MLRGHVKVADFGLARPLKADQSVVNATFCGTPGFMAPEVWENLFSTQSDQWSLAITYLELRLNRRIFKSRDVLSLMQEIRKGHFDLAPLVKAEQRAAARCARIPANATPTARRSSRPWMPRFGPLRPRLRDRPGV